MASLWKSTRRLSRICIGRRSAIVITVKTREEVTELCSKGLRFGGAVKVIEKYWEAGTGLVFMSCTGIDHDYQGKCDKRSV